MGFSVHQLNSEASFISHHAPISLGSAYQRNGFDRSLYGPYLSGIAKASGSFVLILILVLVLVLEPGRGQRL